jgi:hypothetical protein
MNIGSASTPEQLAAYAIRIERILRFVGRQQLKREWVRLSDLARQHGNIAEGYDKLLDSINAGAFEVGGRSRLLYLHPGVSVAKMTRERLADAAAVFDREHLVSAYIAPCWVPSDLAAGWLKSHPAPIPAKPKRGRPVGSTQYDDTPVIARAAELIPIIGTAREAARSAMAELGWLPPEWGNSKSAIEQRIRNPAMAQARANGYRG